MSDYDRAMAACPYYRGVGVCQSGCSSEPACITDEPNNGWLSDGNLFDLSLEKTNGDE